MSRKHLLRCFVCCSKFFFDWKVRCNGVSFNLPAQLWAGKTNQQCCSLSERKISLPWWVPIFSVYPGSSTIEHGGIITAYQLFDWCTTAGTHLFTMQDVQTSCRIWTRTFHVWLPSYLRTSFASYHLKHQTSFMIFMSLSESGDTMGYLNFRPKSGGNSWWFQPKSRLWPFAAVGIPTISTHTLAVRWRSLGHGKLTKRKLAKMDMVFGCFWSVHPGIR